MNEITGRTLAELRTTAKVYEWAARKAVARGEPGTSLVASLLRAWAHDIRDYLEENSAELLAKQNEEVQGSRSKVSEWDVATRSGKPTKHVPSRDDSSGVAASLPALHGRLSQPDSSPN